MKRRSSRTTGCSCLLTPVAGQEFSWAQLQRVSSRWAQRLVSTVPPHFALSPLHQDFLDGLIWRSHKTQDRPLRVEALAQALFRGADFVGRWLVAAITASGYLQFRASASPMMGAGTSRRETQALNLGGWASPGYLLFGAPLTGSGRVSDAWLCSKSWRLQATV